MDEIDEAVFERVRASFAMQPMMATLGARLAGVSRGAAQIALPAASAILQQHGFVHGGAIMTIADSAAGYAAMTTAAADAEVLTIEAKTNFLRPANGGLLAKGKVVRAGRSVVVASADVFARPAGSAEPIHVALAVVTVAVVPARSLTGERR